MVNITTLKFGDKVYVANERNNAFKRQKLKMVDADGVEWYRYDKDVWTYEIVELEYVGCVTYTVEGVVRFDEDRYDEYHFLYPDGQIYDEAVYSDDDDDRENWFLTREAAEEYAAQMAKERNSDL